GSNNPNSVSLSNSASVSGTQSTSVSASTSVSGSSNPNSVSLSNSASAVLPKAGEANSFDLTIAGAGLLGALGVVSKKRRSSK
ncbi:LPXTG cell wall anchor domain-containing protein, partial [Lactococcus lactis]